MKYLLFIFTLLNVSNAFGEALDGEQLFKESCSECHQADGNSNDQNIPKIAQFSAALTFDILDQFKSGYRAAKDIKDQSGKITNMAEISKKLSESEMDALSLFLSTTTFKPEKQVFNKSLIEAGKQLHQDLCDDCHVGLATSTEDDAPILAGQWRLYLTDQFVAFTSHKRKMTRRMKRKFRKLTDDDKTALIEFYASRSACRLTTQDKD